MCRVNVLFLEDGKPKIMRHSCPGVQTSSFICMAYNRITMFIKIIFIVLIILTFPKTVKSICPPLEICENCIVVFQCQYWKIKGGKYRCVSRPTREFKFVNKIDLEDCNGKVS